MVLMRLLNIFLSTSSARRTTTRADGRLYNDKISIHVLREEDDATERPTTYYLPEISIHVLREEDD